MDYYLKGLATSHDSYLQDTPDFVRTIEDINDQGVLPENALLATFDVMSSFTNIPQKEGISCAEQAFIESDIQTVPTEYIISMRKIILQNSIFSFDEQLYTQNEGTIMGHKFAPHYADIFLARNIDQKVNDIFRKYEEKNPNSINRFLDDILKLYLDTTQNLHRIFEEMNNIHPSIKFTMSHTTNHNKSPSTRCNCEPQESIPYLDTSCKIINER